VETLTPTFSKTRPSRITAITPPPPSASPRASRLLALEAAGGGAAKGPVSWASSSASKAAQMRSRSSANQAAARSLWASVTVGDMGEGPPAGRGQAYRQGARTWQAAGGLDAAGVTIASDAVRDAHCRRRNGMDDIRIKRIG
jgi:hypothetical protein